MTFESKNVHIIKHPSLSCRRHQMRNKYFSEYDFYGKYYKLRQRCITHKCRAQWHHKVIRSDQLLSRVRFFVTPRIAAHQASLSITNSRSSLRLMSIEPVMPSSHLILCRPLLLLPPIPPSIRVFSNESTLHMRWPKYWSFRFSIIRSKEIPGLIFRMD